MMKYKSPKQRAGIDVLIRLAIVVVLLLLLRPTSEVFRIQDWLTKGDQAAQDGGEAEARSWYEQADLLAPDLLNIDQRINTQFPKTSTARDASMVYLLNDVEKIGWTSDLRQQYVKFLEATDQLTAVRFLLDDDSSSGSADIDTLWLLFEDRIRRSDWDGARTRLQQILSINPESSRANYHLGNLLAIENPEAAGGYLTFAAGDATYAANAQRIYQILQAVPADDPATRFRSLGTTFVENQEWAYAEQAFSEALSLDSLDWYSYAYHGYVRDHRGADGFEDIETAVALAPNTALPYYFMGLHWRSAQHLDLEKAQEAFSQAYLIDAENPAYALEIAQTFELQNQYELARNWYATAAELGPDNPDILRLQAAFYADTEYLLAEEGVEIIEEAHRVAPDNGDILTSLGRAYFLQGNISEARNYLEDAARSSPNSPRTRYYFGLLLQRQGDTVAAIRQLERAVESSQPDSQFGILARRALAQLTN